MRPRPKRRAGRDINVPAIARLLRSWYAGGHRSLPWRETSDPYAIWISEVMLQQTQVAKVLPYYTRFLRRFPDLESLASAHEAEVLKLWEGLGYYRRARNLIPAARMVMAAGGWPREAAALSRLPGIGRTTAGAVASIAFGEIAPILDGNVKRVWSRVIALDAVISGKVLQRLWALSEAAVSAGDAAAVNQALMELGATVCTPRAPRCPECPIRGRCEGNKRGDPEAYPIRASRAARPVYDVSVALLWRNGAFLVTRRPSEGLLGGLWELPGGKWERDEDGESALRRELSEELGVEVDVVRAHSAVAHAYSHFAVRLHAFDCALRGHRRPKSTLPMRWITPEQIGSLAFPTGTLKVFSKALRFGLRAAAEQAAEYAE